MVLELQEPFKSVWRKGYLRVAADGRRYLDLVNSNTDRTTTSYARYLMSVKIGQFIPEGYEVDHRDDDRTNDVIDNLQIVTAEYNRLKEHYRYVTNEQAHYGLYCAYCHIPFLLTEREVKARLAKKVELAFCSRQCAGYYHSVVSGRSSTKRI